MSPPSPSLLLLDPFVRTYLAADGDTAEKNPRRVLSSGANLAIGIPAEKSLAMDAVVRGLALEAELAGAPDLTRLTLRGSNQLSTCIHAVDKNLIIITTNFPGVYYGFVYIIYDAIDRSLRVIPCAPSTRAPIFTGNVLVARRRDDDRSYALVYPGSVYGTGGRLDNVLFVSPSTSTSPWETTKYSNYPSHLLADESFFVAEEVFSHRGRGYWADLLLGAAYCDCAAVLSDDTDTVDIHYLDLPQGCQYVGSREDIVAVPRAFRAMGCAGGSVKLVSITGYLERVDLVEDRTVRVWRLTEDDMSWELDDELRLGSLWEEDAEFKGNGVPTCMEPMYPFLSEQEDHVMYFALGDYPSKPRCWVRVDMSSKTFNCTPFSLTNASMGRLLAVSGDAEGKLFGLPAKRKFPAI